MADEEFEANLSNNTQTNTTRKERQLRQVKDKNRAIRCISEIQTSFKELAKTVRQIMRRAVVIIQDESDIENQRDIWMRAKSDIEDAKKQKANSAAIRKHMAVPYPECLTEGQKNLIDKQQKRKDEADKKKAAVLNPTSNATKYGDIFAPRNEANAGAKPEIEEMSTSSTDSDGTEPEVEEDMKYADQTENKSDPEQDPNETGLEKTLINFRVSTPPRSSVTSEQIPSPIDSQSRVSPKRAESPVKPVPTKKIKRQKRTPKTSKKVKVEDAVEEEESVVDKDKDLFDYDHE